MKILIRLPNWLGDAVMSTALTNAVLQLYPQAEIDIIIKNELAQVAELITGVRKIFLFSKKDHPGLRGAYRFGKDLCENKYDLYLNLPVSLSSIAMAFATRATKRIGFNVAGGIFLLTKAYLKPLNVHRVDEYVSLIESFSGKQIARKKVRLSGDPSTSTRRNVIINFNSEAESRRMPIDKGTGVLNLLAENFEHKFLLIGSAKDFAFVNDIIGRVNDPSRFENLAGKTNLLELTKLLSEASVVLTTDSGPAHLANSVGTPVVVLFGAGNERNTAPYNKEGLEVLRAGKLSCEPCVQNTCKLYGLPKCMQLLDESAILNALRLYLPHA